MTRPRFPEWRSVLEGAIDSDSLRLTLIASGMALIVAGAGGIVYLKQAQAPIRQALASQPAQSRLPRPRPPEPAMTGSIEPRASAATLSAAPAPSPADARVEELRKDAMLLAASRADCGGGIRSEVLESAAGPAARIVIAIECGNGTRFYLDQDQIEQGGSPTAPQRSARLDDAEAIAACEEKLKFGLPVPSSFSRLRSSTGVDRAPGDEAVVTFDFDARNGLGFPLTMQAQCLFQEREIARLEVNPR